MAKYKINRLEGEYDIPKGLEDNKYVLRPGIFTKGADFYLKGIVEDATPDYSSPREYR